MRRNAQWGACLPAADRRANPAQRVTRSPRPPHLCLLARVYGGQAEALFRYPVALVPRKSVPPVPESRRMAGALRRVAPGARG